MPFLVQLALKHRQNRNQKMKIIAFVGSPIQDGERDVSMGHIIVQYSVLDTIVYTPVDDKIGQEVEERESDCGHC